MKKMEKRTGMKKLTKIVRIKRHLSLPNMNREGYSNASTIPTFKREVVNDERMTNVKTISDPDQLRARKERDMKEAERLLHFDLQFAVTPLKLGVLIPDMFPTKGLNEY